MKLPFSFGLTLALRVLLPGSILTLGLAPIFQSWINVLGIKIDAIAAFTFGTVLIGWVINATDMGVYKIFEGRDCRPQWLCLFFRNRQHKRIERIKGRINKYIDKVEANGSQIAKEHFGQKASEVWVKLREYPIDSEGLIQVDLPFRLGNVIYGYEGYSAREYGKDAVFYWPKLWLSLDTDVRRELDEQQAMADSGVYLATVLVVLGSLYLGYSIGLLFNYYYCSHEIDTASYVVHKYAVSSVAAYLAAFLAYTIAIRLHVQYGETFKAVFDQFHSRVDFEQMALASYDKVTQKPSPQITNPLRAMMFMMYRRVYCPICNVDFASGKLDSHMSSKHGITLKDRQEQIAQNAYFRAQQRGFLDGTPEQDWLDAEKEIDNAIKNSAEDS